MEVSEQVARNRILNNPLAKALREMQAKQEEINKQLIHSEFQQGKKNASHQNQTNS